MSPWKGNWMGVALVLGVAGASGTGCATRDADAVRWQAPPLDATWTVALRNAGSYGRDAQVQYTRRDGQWQGRPAVAYVDGSGTTALLAPETGYRIAVVGRDGKPALSWDPPLGWPQPFKVGAALTQQHRMTMHAAGRDVPYELSCKVEAREAVSVPAGRFDTWRVGCTTTIGNDEVYWMSEPLGIAVKTRLVRSAASPFGAGTQEGELVAHTIVR